MTSKVKQTMSNSAAAYQHIETMGETEGASKRALWNAGTYVSNYIATEGAPATDETFAAFAAHYAAGQEKAMGGDKITEGSRNQYRDTFKLLADPIVRPRLAEIAARTDEFCTAVELDARGNRRFMGIAKALASAVRKNKLGGEMTVKAVDSKGKEYETFNPVLFAEKFPKKAEAAEETEAQKIERAKESFRQSAIFLQTCGVFNEAASAKLREAAVMAGLSVLVPTPAPVAAPAPAAPDMQAMLAQFAAFMTAQQAK